MPIRNAVDVGGFMGCRRGRTPRSLIRLKKRRKKKRRKREKKVREKRRRKYVFLYMLMNKFTLTAHSIL